MAENGEYTNHLSNETSPYLLQHAHNPVAWYPWGPEALAKARSEQKPILLSVGYSACHWCHVMAHESFEDPDVAALMNELFVNIKVDREERPDLDKIYQTAHALLTRRTGGWPLTMFLTPDERIPFFGGTYFPKQPRFGLPGFADLMQRVAGFFREQQAEITAQNESLIQALRSLATPELAPGRLNALPLDLARQQLDQQFDEQHGGFGSAPKFPHPTSLERLLRHWAGSVATGTPDTRALHMATFTLERMALGGMNDQIGGGFCRYSVDDQWMIPHFEKMLYDNGPLLALYSEVSVATGSALFARVARETAAWIMREMQSPEGGYYSSLDADSEGQEGKFYVWTREEAQEVLGEDYPLFAHRFGFDRSANFEGKWNPHVYAGIETLAKRYSLSEQHVTERLDSARQKLFSVRNRRIPPGRDEKILTSWNGLMIKGMACAGRHLGEATWLQSAENALDFVRSTLWRDGRLLATYKDGRAHLQAYLDDYVFLIDGILELLQARWRQADLEFALELTDAVLEHFQDADGGFYFTADDHEALIQRPKPTSDDATPSGNAMAARALGRLGHLLGETAYLEAAERTLQSLWSVVQQSPAACSGLLTALEEHLFSGQTIVLRGNPETMGKWHARAVQPYAPRRLMLAIPGDVTGLPGILDERSPQGEMVAYVCTGTACGPPVRTFDEFDAILQASEVPQIVSHQSVS